MSEFSKRFPGFVFLGLRKISFLQSTYGVTRFLFFYAFPNKILRPRPKKKEFRSTIWFLILFFFTKKRSIAAWECRKDHHSSGQCAQIKKNRGTIRLGWPCFELNVSDNKRRSRIRRMVRKGLVMKLLKNSRKT